MKWSDSITLDRPLGDVRLLAEARPQNWNELLKDREQIAHERGRREGESALNAQLIQQRNEIGELLNGVIGSLQRVVPELIQQSESALIQLALESAKKMVAGLPIDAEMVEAVIREALREIEDGAEIKIQLHPDDLALLHKQNSTLLNGLPGTSSLRFVASPDVTRGGCLVQTRFGIIDARRETKLQQLRQSISA